MDPVMVHRRRFVDGKGRERVEEVVLCPREGCLRPADSCRTCGHGGEVRYDARFDADVVNCSSAPHASVTAVPDASRARLAEPLRAISVGQVCSRDILCADPDAPLRVLARIFDEHALGTIPVADRAGRLLGMVSPTDLVAPPPEAKCAADLMTKGVVTTVEAMPITRASAIMAFEGIHHLPVLGWAGSIVGMLSSLDVLRFIGQASGALIPRATRRSRQKQDE